MTPKNGGSAKMKLNRGAWTAEEDLKLSQCIQIHGEKRWRLVPAKAGLNRCGKSCRLRWLNYLRPNIKRGNISDQEEDLIIRLHKLLGNRWSLIAGRLPGRTDNEIKNYWNSHLSKRINGTRNEKKGPESHNSASPKKNHREMSAKGPPWKVAGVSTSEFNVDELSQYQEDERAGTTLDSQERKAEMEIFDGSDGPNKGHLGWDWVRELLEFDERWKLEREEGAMGLVSLFRSW